jgi:hypothetical protein
MVTTYAPPARTDQLPTSRDDWHRRTGLTDPVVIAAFIARRLETGPVVREPSYADFFSVE